MVKSEFVLKPIENSYPRIRQREVDGLVVLFHQSTSGTVIVPDRFGIHDVGYYSTNWGFSEFKDTDIAVMLQNEA